MGLTKGWFDLISWEIVSRSLKLPSSLWLGFEKDFFNGNKKFNWYDENKTTASKYKISKYKEKIEDKHN